VLHHPESEEFLPHVQMEFPNVVAMVVLKLFALLSGPVFILNAFCLSS